MNTYRTFIMFFISVLLFSTPLLAEEKKGWKVLGMKNVSADLERDQIMINKKKGTFSKVKLQVKKAPIELERMVIHFNKKEKQVVWLRNNFKADSWSRPINIKGGKRPIQKVVLWYSQKEAGGSTPRVFLWGKQ